MLVERIKRLCNENGLNIKKLEENVKLSNGQISKWKTQAPRADMIIKIANYFNVSIEYLLTGKENNLSEKETKLVKYYKESDERGKESIIHVAEFEAKRTKAEELKPFA